LRQIELGPGGSLALGKTVSVAVQTTRKPYPGIHRVEVLLNGRAQPLGEFRLRK